MTVVTFRDDQQELLATWEMFNVPVRNSRIMFGPGLWRVVEGVLWIAANRVTLYLSEEFDDNAKPVRPK